MSDQIKILDALKDLHIGSLTVTLAIFLLLVVFAVACIRQVTLRKNANQDLPAIPKCYERERELPPIHHTYYELEDTYEEIGNERYNPINFELT